jgi:site-specific DNA-cytosine methylase
MITPQTDKKYTMVHAFSGSGGCSSGFDEEGFETLAALDFDADACADLDYLLNRKVAVVVDIEKMEPVDMRRVVGDRRPDVYVATPPCKGWSRLLGKGRRMSDKYVRMCSLAVRSVWLALHAWDEPPPLIVIENVRGMSTEGREMMDIIKRELRAFGYLFDIRTWNVGKIGNLAQSRDRCLFVARNPKRCPAFLMVPTEHPLRPCGDELGRLPPPTLDKASKSMHKLPQLSAMNWLRIAAIPPGKDWKALPARIQLGGNPKDRSSAYRPRRAPGLVGARELRGPDGPRSDDGSPEDEARPQGRLAEVLFSAAAATTATIREPVGHGVGRSPTASRAAASGSTRGAPQAHGRRDVSNTCLHDADHLHAELVRWP